MEFELEEALFDPCEWLSIQIEREPLSAPRRPDPAARPGHPQLGLVIPEEAPGLDPADLRAGLIAVC